MNITEKEEALFDKWEKQRPGFVKDGVVDEDNYLQSNPRLLFVMKEVNSPGSGGWDLRKFLRAGADTPRPRTWDNITRWVYGIRNKANEINWLSLEKMTPEQRKEILSSVCVVNLKKSPGGNTTDNYELDKIAREDKEYLTEQFSFYNPDLIIGCGSMPTYIFHDLFKFEQKWKITKRGIGFLEFMNNKYLISFSHPQARVQDCLLYYGLIDAVKEIWTSSKNHQSED